MKIVGKFLILLMLAVPFVGCSDDDDDGDDYAAIIAGTYKGDLYASDDLQNPYMTDVTITLTRTGNNVATLSTTLTVTIPTMGEQTVPINCTNTAVGKDEDGDYAVAGETKVLSVIDVDVTGYVFGDNNEAEFMIVVSATTPPLDLTFLFSGEKQ